jgi:acyl carrier protein
MDRNELGNILMELVEKETGEKCPPLDDTAPLRTGLNLDSLDMVSLVFRIEHRLAVKIESEELGRLVTVGNLLDLLQGKLAQVPSRHAA